MHLCLGCCFPFKHALAGDEAPDERADDGVKCEHRLMRKKNQMKQCDKRRAPETCECFAALAFVPSGNRAAKANAN